MAKRNNGNKTNVAPTNVAEQVEGADPAAVASGAPDVRPAFDLLDGQVAYLRGEEALPLGVRIRDILETQSEGGKVLPIDKFLNVMIDKRAPGIWSLTTGGPKGKTESLAELIVTSDMVTSVADLLMNPSLARQVNELLYRSGRRIERGILSYDYPTLLEAVTRVVGASEGSEGDPKRAAARVITEFFAQAYAAYGVLVPYSGVVQPLVALEPVANTRALIRSAEIAQVNEIVEMINLAPTLRDVKKFEPAAVEAMMSPTLTKAANRLYNVARYTKYMYDTAILTGRMLLQHPNLPDHLRDNADLQYLCTNASWALDTIGLADEVISTPDFELRDAISHTVTRLRELKRYEMVTISAFASMYQHSLVKNNAGYIAGVFASRNTALDIGVQVSRYVEYSSLFTQNKVEAAEAYLMPMTSAVQKAYAGELLCNQMSTAAATYLTRQSEWRDDLVAQAFTFMMTPAELSIYAMNFADSLTLIDVNYEGVNSARLCYSVVNKKAFYEPRGLFVPPSIETIDPAEVLILSNADHTGTAQFPTRPQGLLEDCRSALFAGNPDKWAVRLGRAMIFDVNTATRGVSGDGSGGISYRVSYSLSDLLNISDYARLSLFKEPANAELFMSTLAGLVYVYRFHEKSSSDIDRMVRHSLATQIHQLVTLLATDPSLVQYFRRIFRAIMIEARNGGYTDIERSTLSERGVKYSLAVQFALMLLIRMGIMEYGAHEEIIRIIQNERMVDQAITSPSWRNVFEGRVTI